MELHLCSFHKPSWCAQAHVNFLNCSSCLSKRTDVSILTGKTVSTQIRRLISPQYEGEKCGSSFPVFHTPSRRLLEHKRLHSSSGVTRLRKCTKLQLVLLFSQSLTLYIVYILTLKFSRYKRVVLSYGHLSLNFCFTDYLVFILEILYIRGRFNK